MRYERIHRTLGRGISRKRANRGTRDYRGNQHNAASRDQDRQQLLHEEERRSYVDGKQVVKVLYRRGLDGGRLRYTRVGDQDVQPFTDNLAHALRQVMRTVR